jgi:hypothetical protein
MSIAEDPIDFNEITQTGTYQNVMNIPFFPSRDPVILTFYNMPGEAFFDQQVQLEKERRTFIKTKYGNSIWYEIWPKAEEAEKPVFTKKQEERIKEMIVEMSMGKEIPI